MNGKPRKILNIFQDESNLYVDIRISVPKPEMSQEFVDDIVGMKDNMINGIDFPTIRKEFGLLVESEEGKDVLKFQSSVIQK